MTEEDSGPSESQPFALAAYPGEKPVLHKTFAAYKKSRGHTINHFHEKLLLLKGRLHTREAKRIAKKRHEYLVTFLKTFHRAWKGTD